MRLTPSDPDVQTLITRISSGEIDLQPEFQRGEVWPTSKKQKLIDSILRDWHIPPVHVIVESDTGQQLVLDGQQRMAAIRDFVAGEFAVDGRIEPKIPDLENEHGKRYSTLRQDLKRRFDQFTIRVFRITDYLPEEPGELFYRLNQPTALTAAEQRNAFFGETRRQVKALITQLDLAQLDENFWRFSNSRMAYDDIITRAAFLLEQKSLKRRVNAGTLADLFRSGEGFSIETTDALSAAISLLGTAKQNVTFSPQLNKATAQSWLLFIAVANKTLGQSFTDRHVSEFLSNFERNRINKAIQQSDYINREDKLRIFLFRVFEDRSTSRVADVLSVQLRDFVLWSFFAFYYGEEFPNAHQVIKASLACRDFASRDDLDAEALIEKFISFESWGDPLWR